MATEISFVVDDARIVTALRAKGARLVGALATKLTSLMIQLQRKIVTEYLSGQVLHHMTGKLAGSVSAHPAEVRGNVLIAWVDAFAGAAWYGKVHEFGGTRSYVIFPANKKALAFMMGGKQVFARSVVHPPLPQRPTVRPAFEAFQPEIVSGLAETVTEVLNG